MESYDHLVKIEEGSRTLSIYRVFGKGTSEFLTSVELPEISAQKSDEEFEAFAKQLGENILLDSPVARKLLDI